MPRYRVEPHNSKGPFGEDGNGDGPQLESIETTYSDTGSKVLSYRGFGACQTAERHQREEGGVVYVNAVSRDIVRQDFQGASNAPVYYAIAESPVYTPIRHDGKVVRAYWPVLGA